MEEGNIQDILFLALQGGQRFKRSIHCIVPNCKYFKWESDVIMMTRSGLLYEYEIKRTLQDFNADFKDKREKHRMLRNAIGVIPNFFYFVCPDELVPKLDLPGYAGLITFRGDIIKFVKYGPELHQGRCSSGDQNRLLTKMYYKYWSNRVYK